MKKVLIIFICLSMVLTMISCNRSPDDGSDGSPSSDISNDQASANVALGTGGGDDNPAANPASDFQYVFSENGESVYISKYIGTSETVVIPSESRSDVPCSW